MPWGAGRGLLCLALLVEESTARRLHAQAMAIVAVARCPCGQVHSWANMDSVSMQIYCRNCVTDWRGNDRSCHHIACRNRDAPQSCQQHSKPWEIPTLGVTQGHLTFSCDKLWAVTAHNLSAVCNARHTLILDRHLELSCSEMLFYAVWPNIALYFVKVIYVADAIFAPSCS